MHLRDIQKSLGGLMEQYSLPAKPEARMLDLLSEAGELAKVILHSTNYGTKPFRLSEHCRMELGDLLFSLVCLANTTGVDLEESLARVLIKLRQRFESGGSARKG